MPIITPSGTSEPHCKGALRTASSRLLWLEITPMIRETLGEKRKARPGEKNTAQRWYVRRTAGNFGTGLLCIQVRHKGGGAHSTQMAGIPFVPLLGRMMAVG